LKYLAPSAFDAASWNPSRVALIATRSGDV
jgi:hypothetical protein